MAEGPLRQTMAKAQREGKKKFKYGQSDYEIVTSKKTQGSKLKTRAVKQMKKGT